MSFCHKCGKEIIDGIKFCPDCGTNINAAIAYKQLTVNKPIENSAKSQPYTTIQYFPGYEQASEHPKIKKNKLIPALIVIVLIVIGLTIGLIKYYIGDAYKYKKAIEMLDSGNYEIAFSMFYSLGNYEDSEFYLPFHGNYKCISYFDKKSVYTFKEGEYTENYQFEDHDESQKHGTLEFDEFNCAVLTEDADEYGNVITKMYQAYDNYIYHIGDEGYVFKEKVDVSHDCLSGTFSKSLRHETNMVYFENDTYVFEEDGTYSWSEETVVYEGEQSEKYVLDSNKGDGTYVINGNIITLTSNEDNG